jgi:hypothetical protein
MYASVKPWINIPYQYRPFLKYSGAGVKQFGEPVSSLCYPVGDTKFVTDVNGAQKVSTMQLYVDGTEAIKVNDSVLIEGEERAIYRITSYYRNGAVDLRVVYL